MDVKSLVLVAMLGSLLLISEIRAAGLSSKNALKRENPISISEAAAAANDGVVFDRCIQNGTIALTFDDGPAPGNTDAILALLRTKNVPATFFVIGISGLTTEPGKQTLRGTWQNGHLIGHHSWSHTWPGLIDLQLNELLDEMNRLTDALREILGEIPAVMRPPFGAIDDQLIRVVNGQMGMKLILWSIDTNDWQHPGDTQSGVFEYTRMLYGTNPAQTPGFISLHHDPLEGSLELASQAIDVARGYGYRFVSLKECLGL